MSQRYALLIDNLADRSRLSCWMFVSVGVDDEGNEADLFFGPFTSAGQAFEWADAVGMRGFPLAVTDPFSDKSRLKDPLISQNLRNL